MVSVDFYVFWVLVCLFVLRLFFRLVVLKVLEVSVVCGLLSLRGFTLSMSSIIPVHFSWNTSVFSCLIPERPYCLPVGVRVARLHRFEGSPIRCDTDRRTRISESGRKNNLTSCSTAKWGMSRSTFSVIFFS